MEVLIAAGVTAVGLFGVLALIPLAAVQVGRGVTEDRKALLGKSAASEFDIRGMRNPGNWVFHNPNTGVAVPAFNANSPQAFCIDPRFVAVHKSVVFPYPAAAASPPLPSIVFMNRITLQSTLGPMSAQLADEIFMSQDDLEFVIPAGDRTQPPVQTFTSGNTKRQSAGHYSWLAMVVPKHGTISDEYVLSIVVFYKRDRDMLRNDTTNAAPADVNERVVSVLAFSGGGVNGGEVTLQAATSLELDAIPQNTWIMLAGNTNSGSADFKWYRVLAADDIDAPVPPSPNFTRSLTLQGADWQRPEWIGGAAPTQATIVSGVVGVFEKTIRLETTSLWTQ